MSNSFDAIRKSIDLRAPMEEIRLERLEQPISEHIEEKLNSWAGLRKWIPEAKESVTITENSQPTGGEITSKKGEIAEQPFDATVGLTEFVPYGIRQSITNGQLEKLDENAPVDVLYRFMLGMGRAMKIAEMLVFVNRIMTRLEEAQRTIPCECVRIDTLNNAFKKIEQENAVCHQLVLGANPYATFRTFGRDFYDEATTREFEMTGVVGHIWTGTLYLIPHASFKHVLCLGRVCDEIVYREGRHGNQEIDSEKSKYRYAAEHVLPTEPLSVKYSYVPHNDPARSRHIFEAKTSIGVRINNLTWASALKITEG